MPAVRLKPKLRRCRCRYRCCSRHLRCSWSRHACCASGGGPNFCCGCRPRRCTCVPFPLLLLLELRPGRRAVRLTNQRWRRAPHCLPLVHQKRRQLQLRGGRWRHAAGLLHDRCVRSRVVGPPLARGLEIEVACLVSQRQRLQGLLGGGGARTGAWAERLAERLAGAAGGGGGRASRRAWVEQLTDGLVRGWQGLQGRTESLRSRQARCEVLQQEKPHFLLPCHNQMAETCYTTANLLGR